MAKKELNAVMAEVGGPVLVGELRGCVLEAIRWTDDKGVAKTGEMVKVAIETGVYPSVHSYTLNCGERGLESETAKRIQAIPRGASVCCPIQSWVRTKGSVTGLCSDVLEISETGKRPT